MSTTKFDIMDPSLVEDPFGRYGELREQEPVSPIVYPGVDAVIWLVTRHEDVKAVLNDPRLVRDRRSVPGMEGPSITDQMIETYGLPEEYRDYFEGMVIMDGKNHARLRTLVTPSFTVRRVNERRERVARILDKILENVAGREQFDLIEDVAFPLAGNVVCDLIGVEESDWPRFHRWIHDFNVGDPSLLVTCVPEMVEYTKALIARRRAEPGDDMISRMIRTSDDDGGRLTDTEMVNMVLLLIHAGHNPTAHFVANAVLAFLDNPDQLELLRAEPELVPNAVREMLRVGGSVHLVAPMYATEDVEIAGVRVRQGEAVMAALAAANGDPRRFPEPQRIDLRRETGPGDGHVAFGHGPHYCLGAALAKMTGEVVFDRLIVKEQGLALAVPRETLRRQQMPGAYQLLSLPVRL
ncbi:cytochrome P450 family protein [Streptomyces sp. 8N114]|uniref:cytochrome P450 family protein n=1 Tax=Streptomyces sp. 8N114 TaxID=3457419 RepID=UPI003FD133BF